MRSLGVLWGLDFPADFLEVVSAYGNSKISDFIWVYRPRALGFAGEHFAQG